MSAARAIISAACIFFTQFFTAVYIVEWLVLQTIYVLSMEIISIVVTNMYLRFIIESSFKSRAGYNGARRLYEDFLFAF
jgi:hypothetical protein